MTKDTTSKILSTLDKQEKEEGSLPLLLEFYRKLLKIQSRAGKRISTPAPDLDSAAVDRYIERGAPFLVFDKLDIDWGLARELFVEVLALFARYPQLFGEIPDKFKRPAASRLLTKKAVKAWFTGKELPPSLLDGLSDSFARAIIQATIQPFMASYGRSFAGSLKPDFWREGYCPVCGGSPDLAYLEKNVGVRWLVCSRCDTEWRFPRLDCPFCRTQKQSSQQFFTDEKELYRLHVCDECKGYLKTIDLRKTENEVLLPLERVLTLDIDKQAVEKGYRPSRHPS